QVANRELEAFSYSVAHDLRAPLRGMNGFAKVLLDDYGEKLDTDGKECLNQIHANATRMASLIDGLLSLSRTTRSEVKAESVDLSKLVRAVANEVAAAESKPKVALDVEDGVQAMLDPR